MVKPIKIKLPKALTSKELERRYSFAEARKIRGPFVYGLEDAAGIFYVGKTIDADRRFSCYIDPKRTALKLQRRIRDAQGAVLVRILIHNPPDLAAAERTTIAALAPHTVNKMESARHITAGMPSAVARRMLNSHLARCPECDNQNFRDGRHLCSNTRLEILNPGPTGKVQEIMLESGIMREGFEVPRVTPKLYDPR